MNKILSFLIALAILAFTSCSKDEPTPEETTIPVTYATMSGNWQLVELDGQPLAEGLYLYMTLDRKEQTFSICSNYRSPYSQTQTGTFTIDGDDYAGYTVSGTYGVVAGDWTHKYRVDYIYASGRMKWTSTDNDKETQVFMKVDSIPSNL